MKKIARLSNEERQELFLSTAIKMGMRPEVIEKDFWVCFMLDHLFHDCEYKNAFVFKGGTSLSKAYHVIKRFSEDIDLILDWRKIITDASNPWDDRSRTKQDSYNKQINKEAAMFYRDSLVPKLKKELSDKLGNGEWIFVDSEDEMVVNFVYPHIFETAYIIPVVRLEIGPLAEWMPSHVTNIVPFVAEHYDWLFEQKNTDVLTIDAERTFWEKITILHKIANFPEGKTLPHRYARHLYDVYCLGNSDIKELAFKKNELLEKDVAFKLKFYYAKSAHYETATLKHIRLIPAAGVMQTLKNDYAAMINMFYGNAPEFDEIIQYLRVLEEEIHKLEE
ncbi:MAG: nucleotidyl transferase AbiEii/AbiGii toxin family protein [Lachnospiraceae bacterium]|nr:nucleotidyl transferase AbiEii/AbiGii toxin family protein [Lachnospiraceae bacterium]